MPRLIGALRLALGCSLACLLVGVLATGCTPLAPSDGVRTAADILQDVPHAPDSLAQRGVTVGLYFTDEARSYRSYFWEARQAGATSVSLVWAWRQPGIDGVPRREDGLTPSDAELTRAITAAHEMGLDVFLLPILQLDRVSAGEWRGTLEPTDRAAWWTAYRQLVIEAASLAGEHGVAWFSVGSELGSMERDAAQWRSLIADVRGRTDAALTYSANWDHVHRTPFWSELDAIGVTGYFELTEIDEHRPTADELDAAWAGVVQRLTSIARVEDRPLVITEIGYVSQRGAARHPWNYTRGLPVDLLAQYDLYAGLARAWSAVPELRGVYVWNWFGDGGSFDDGYTPRQKPAEQALRQWYGAPVSGAGTR